MIGIDRIKAFICGRKVGTLASAGREIIRDTESECR